MIILPVRGLSVHSRVPALPALTMDFIAEDGIPALPALTRESITADGIPALPTLTAGRPQPGQGCRGATQAGHQGEDVITDWQAGEKLLN